MVEDYRRVTARAEVRDGRELWVHIHPCGQAWGWEWQGQARGGAGSTVGFEPTTVKQ